MAKDSLSALLDGECSPAELNRILEDMERSPDLKQAWSRLCLARDAGEGVRVRQGQSCICSAVMANLDPPSVSVVDRVVPRRMRGRVRRAWKPAMGLALAASVAAVAVVLNVRDTGPAVLPGVAGPQFASEASLPMAQRRPRYLQTVAAGPTAADGVRRAAIDDELRSYLIEHSNTLAGRGMGATLPYARFAAHSVGDPAVMSISTDLVEDRP